MRKCRGILLTWAEFLRQWKKEGRKGTENETLYLQQQYRKASSLNGENKKRDEDRIQDRKIFLDFS